MRGRRRNTLEDIGRMAVEARKAAIARRSSRCETPASGIWCQFQGATNEEGEVEPIPEEQWCTACRARFGELAKAERKAKNTLSAAISRYLKGQG